MEEKIETSAQEREFSVFGISKQLRSGLMIGLLSISLFANYLMYLQVLNAKDEILKVQGGLYERVIKEVDRKVDIRLEEPISKINSAVDAVDTAAKRVKTAAEKSEIASDKVINHKKRR